MMKFFLSKAPYFQLLLGFFIGLNAAAEDGQPPDPGSFKQDAFVAAKRSSTMIVPNSIRNTGTAVWSYLVFMTDPSGSPYDISLFGSSKNEKFNRASLKRLSESSFEPALHKGVPVHSMGSIGWSWQNPSNSDKTLSKRFKRYFPLFLQSYDEDKQKRSAELIANMQKEPAASLLQLNMTSFALGNFDLKWGDSYDALNHFDDAIAWTSKDEVSDSDLPEMLLKTTLLNLYQLEFNARLFQNALQTHELMEGRIGQDILRSLKPYQKEIERLKKEGKPYSIDYSSNKSKTLTHVPLRTKLRLTNIIGPAPKTRIHCDIAFIEIETTQLSQGFALPLDRGNCAIRLDVREGTSFSIIESVKKSST